MKKFVFLFACTALMVISLNFIVKSDNRESAVVDVSAEVLGSLDITSDVGVNFGNISSSTTGEVFLDPKGIDHSYVGVSATAGHLTVSGDGTNLVRLGWPADVELVNGELASMTYTLAVSGNGDDIQSSSSDLLLEGGYCTVGLVANNFYLWVGGSLGTLDNVDTGTYTGSVVFTVEYN
ncbi:MAG: DUF4402 domain-containing protein [Prolixibacteraceae bacterium]|nr:DUF4402 domain-containing protein [Prolixibacteraceae bacterium]